MRRDQLAEMQWAKLAAGLDLVFSHNRFYQAKYRAVGLERRKVCGLQDLPALPLTTKDELLADQEAEPPYGRNLTFPLDRYKRLHQTSGTSGRRLRWLDTADSWDWILGCWQRIYDAAGVTAAERVFLPFSFGPFLGFWAGCEGALRRGAFVLAGGGLTTAARLTLMLENAATTILCTPTYALRMAEVAAEEGLDLAASSVRSLIVAGEPGGSIPETRRRIESSWGARVYDHYGMTEIGSLGFEYREQPERLYLLETECIAEFLTADGKPAPEGELAELVLTNLGRWGSPLIRYRTGDLVRWQQGETPTGEPFVYLAGGVLARADQMLWIKGNNVYPSAVESVLRGVGGVAEIELIARQDPAGGVALTIRAEAVPGIDGKALALAISAAVQNRLYFRPTVVVEPPGTLPRAELKANRLRRE